MMKRDEYWKAVLGRDRRFDSKFVYAVGSTGIYCRPSCPSRRPKREYVQFFDLPAQAERAGYRACFRCQPDKAAVQEPHLELVRRICQYLGESSDHKVTLDELARQFNLSPFHLQRTFKRLVGVSPRQFAEARRVELFKEHLKRKESVTEAIYEAGYQSSSRAYGGSTENLGMTPTNYQRGGPSTSIRYSITACPLGWLLVAATGKGICAVRLGDSEAELEAALRGEFSTATIRRDERALGPWVDVLLGYLNGSQPHLDLPLDIKATAFQRRVYEALRAIPYGSTRSYAEVAKSIGEPKAVRAVARACATNPAALAIPCHRVIRSDGGLGGYRWGLDRKLKLLEQERNE